jgi:DNA-binding winged helix-turn-helix (wHTH) protein/tetratricopeptide (TPR) repeat protein
LPKTFEVLCYLAANPGRLVPKDELLKAVWPGSFVEENNLTQHVSLLRRALADRAGYIVTIPGKGYQFTAEVKAEKPRSQPQMSEAQVQSTPELAPGVEADTQASSAEVSPASPPASHKLRKLLRWIGFGVALTLLAAAAITATNAWRRLAHPPQVRKVMVANFTNATGDATFDRTLKRALEIGLEQSPYIDVMSDREAVGTLRLMGRNEASAITPEIAKEICERGNRQVLLTGNITSIGHEYLLTLEATDCESGSKLAAAKEVAGTKERVLAALDSVADHVRRDLGEPSKSMKDFQTPIIEATTASLDALKFYSIGQSMDAQGKSETETLPFYQKAVELDPQFAMAYGAIANEYYNLSEPNLASQFYKKAFDLSDRVSARERLVLQAHYYAEGRKDMQEGANIYRQWTATYPNDWKPWIDLADDYTQLGSYAPAIEAGQQALKLEPNRAINYSVLVRAYRRANRLRMPRPSHMKLCGEERIPPVCMPPCMRWRLPNKIRAPSRARSNGLQAMVADGTAGISFTSRRKLLRRRESIRMRTISFAIPGKLRSVGICTKPPTIF